METEKYVSEERIQVELLKLLVSPHPDYLRTAYEAGITKEILPEFDRCMETEQNTPHHCYNVGEHTLHSLLNIRADKVLRLTMLLHDFGKPVVKRTDEDGRDHHHCYNVGEHTLHSLLNIRADKVLRLTMLLHDFGKPVVKRTDEDGRDHFKTHGSEGEKMAVSILRRLKMDNDTIRKVRSLIKWHDYRPKGEAVSVRKAISLIGEELFPLYLEVQKADILAQSAYRREEKLARLTAVSALYEEILDRGQCISLKTMALTGRDLSDAGYTPGKELGEILEKHLVHVLENPEDNKKEILLKLAGTV